MPSRFKSCLEVIGVNFQEIIEIRVDGQLGV